MRISVFCQISRIKKDLVGKHVLEMKFWVLYLLARFLISFRFHVCLSSSDVTVPFLDDLLCFKQQFWWSGGFSFLKTSSIFYLWSCIFHEMSSGLFASFRDFEVKWILIFLAGDRGSCTCWSWIFQSHCWYWFHKEQWVDRLAFIIFA